MLGLMSLISPQPDCFSIESLPVLTTIADQIATAVENIRLRHKARETAVLAERDRLARDLHDAVTQSLYSLSLFAEAAQESARANDPARIQRHLGSDMKMAQQALGELRLMLFELRADTAARQGLAQALGDRLKSVEERIGIAVDIQAESIGLLPVVVEEAFYRVGLEALNNALRHGPAPHVEVRLFTEDSHLVLTIADDGAGFDVAEATRSGGMGLNSMTQRLQQVGGTLVVDSSPGQGTRVTARTPLLTGGRATSQEVKHG
jgi:signal transduction histidine kinase